MAMATAELTTMVGGPDGVLGIGLRLSGLGAFSGHCGVCGALATADPEGRPADAAASAADWTALPGVLAGLGVPAVAATLALPGAIPTPAVVGAATTAAVVGLAYAPAVAAGLTCLFSRESASEFAIGAATANCPAIGSSTPRM
jgi:hypothetical protein